MARAVIKHGVGLLSSRGSHPACFRLGLAWLGIWIGLLGIADAEILDTFMTVGPEWTAVREVRRLTVQAGEQDLRLDRIPDTADLSTLVIRTRRIPVEQLHWRRLRSVEDEAPAQDGSDRLVLPMNERNVRRAAGSMPKSAEDVVCRIRFPVAGTELFDVHYRMRGLSWSADYQVLLRGDVDGADERMSVSLTGFARMENRSNRDFEQATVRLAGGDPRIPQRGIRLPGFLMMIEGPLADLWQRPEIQPHLEHVYRLPRKVNLSAHARTDLVFADARRIPATRLFVMDSEYTPLSRTGTFHPLGQFLVFRNTAGVGLGTSLPPGPVSVYHGAARRTLQREGFLPHTLREHEIRVDLGPVSNVMGMRRSFGRTTQRGNTFEELFELVVVNNRPSPVNVEIHERPPVALGWTVLRSTQEFEEHRGRIIMRPRLETGERRRIDLRLRLPMPEVY